MVLGYNDMNLGDSSSSSQTNHIQAILLNFSALQHTIMFRNNRVYRTDYSTVVSLYNFTWNKIPLFLKTEEFYVIRVNRHFISSGH